MFQLNYHPEAVEEVAALPDSLRGKMVRLLDQLEARGNALRKECDPCQLGYAASLCCRVWYSSCANRKSLNAKKAGIIRPSHDLAVSV
ncbi:hypothetical protein J2125_001105 [Erwinia toletana]|uniref:Uncharacterized protein n=1 Tax=Winslowiella toletana TaxID=92490 RepID=A0ABS4P5K9_9GAMM|nr:hypothetical protein [Winslowiella toletana]